MALLWSAPDDVRSRWVSDTPLIVDDQTLTKLLEDAEDLILTEFPDIATRIPDPLPELRVKRVIARVVIRHILNPSGLRQFTDTTGPYTSTGMYSGDNPGEMHLTDADRAALSPSVAAGKAYTIDTTPAGYTTLSTANTFQQW